MPGYPTLQTSCLLLLLCTPAIAQHPWQKPSPPVPKAEIDRIIGPITATTTEKLIHALWVWGYDKNHDPGTFMRAVSEGITSPEGMVGTTETMRDWRGKRRGPK